MPDFTMCKGRETLDGKERVCPHAGNCIRVTANPDEYRQGYFAELPLSRHTDRLCAFYMPPATSKWVRRPPIVHHCDICQRQATWFHPQGGQRCDDCPRLDV